MAATTARITDIKCYSVVNPNLGQLCLRRTVRAAASYGGPPHNPPFSAAAPLGQSRVNLRFDLASVLSSEVQAFAFFSNKLSENFGLTFLECAPLAAAMARSALHGIRTGCGPGLLLMTQIEVVYALLGRSPPPQAGFIDGGLILNGQDAATRFPTTRRGGGLSARIPLPPSRREAEFIDGALILNPATAAAARFPTARGGGGEGMSEREICSLKRGPFAGAEEEVCSICLDEFRRGSSVVTTLPPPCGHVFHSRCIPGWLRRNRTCPVCRRRVS
ncbi:hypothetical protein DM860_015729 [Cuscuta australis]|uniref:RING-type domain-containing protein n=1 Tax=Cuscuta australis TaxID=267555 RepID=A0A328DQL3_9ASTE|nr:hypothetical protein DM860_015729 [Cuscuta australis]